MRKWLFSNNKFSSTSSLSDDIYQPKDHPESGYKPTPCVPFRSHEIKPTKHGSVSVLQTAQHPQMEAKDTRSCEREIGVCVCLFLCVFPLITGPGVNGLFQHYPLVYDMC